MLSYLADLSKTGCAKGDDLRSSLLYLFLFQPVLRMTNYDQLIKVLKELFQLNQAELDFGIYR
ncbi:MAG TPA: hypothetical protein PK198_19315, partial [Saprospiraceae bacterium]|nr:hypothetical protein [Saprospiraceae bacterium]